MDEINNNLVDNQANVSTVNQASANITQQESTEGAQTPAAQNVIGNYAPTAVTDGVDTSQFKTEKFQGYANQLGQLYNQQMQNTQTQMNQAYQQNLKTMQDQQEEGIKAYRQQADQFSAQSAINQKNSNAYNQYNGVNTGAASQQTLSQSNAYNAGMSQINTARADFEANVAKAIADMETEYRNNLANALSSGQFELAQQIYTMMQSEDTYREQLAMEWANNGDFSLLEELGIYSPKALVNLKLKYGLSGQAGSDAILTELIKSGKVSGAYVYNMTGKELGGYKAPRRYYGSYSPTSSDKSENGDSTPNLLGQEEVVNKDGTISQSTGITGITDPNIRDNYKKSGDKVAASIQGSVAAKSTQQKLSTNSATKKTVGLSTTKSTAATSSVIKPTSAGGSSVSKNASVANIVNAGKAFADNVTKTITDKITQSAQNGEKVQKINDGFVDNYEAMQKAGVDSIKDFVGDNKSSNGSWASITANKMAADIMKSSKMGESDASKLATELQRQLSTRGTISRDYSKMLPDYKNLDEHSKQVCDASYDAIDTLSTNIAGEVYDSITDAIMACQAKNGAEANSIIMNAIRDPEFAQAFIVNAIVDKGTMGSLMSKGLGISQSDFQSMANIANHNLDMDMTEWMKEYNGGVYAEKWKDGSGNSITFAQLRTAAGQDVFLSDSDKNKYGSRIRSQFGISKDEALAVYSKMKGEAERYSLLTYDYDTKTSTVNPNSILLQADAEGGYAITRLAAVNEINPFAYNIAMDMTIANMGNGYLYDEMAFDGKMLDSQTIYNTSLIDVYGPNQLGTKTTDWTGIKNSEGDMLLGFNYDTREHNQFTGELLENSYLAMTAYLAREEYNNRTGYASKDATDNAFLSTNGFSIFGDNANGYNNSYAYAAALADGNGAGMIADPISAIENGRRYASEYYANVDPNAGNFLGLETGTRQADYWGALANYVGQGSDLQYTGSMPIYKDIVTQEQKDAYAAGADSYADFMNIFAGNNGGKPQRFKEEVQNAKEFYTPNDQAGRSLDTRSAYDYGAEQAQMGYLNRISEITNPKAPTSNTSNLTAPTNKIETPTPSRGDISPNIDSKYSYDEYDNERDRREMEYKPATSSYDEYDNERDRREMEYQPVSYAAKKYGVPDPKNGSYIDKKYGTFPIKTIDEEKPERAVITDDYAGQKYGTKTPVGSDYIEKKYGAFPVKTVDEEKPERFYSDSGYAEEKYGAKTPIGSNYIEDKYGAFPTNNGESKKAPIDTEGRSLSQRSSYDYGEEQAQMGYRANEDSYENYVAKDRLARENNGESQSPLPEATVRAKTADSYLESLAEAINNNDNSASYYAQALESLGYTVEQVRHALSVRYNLNV